MLVARLGVMRLGASRLGAVQPTTAITINGTNRLANVHIAGMTIRDYLDGQPNLATMRVDGFAPTKGHEVKAWIAGRLEFGGNIQTVTQIVLAQNRANVAYDLTCISGEWLLNRRKVTKKYTNQSATTIAKDLIASFTSGFTSVSVVSGLDVLDEFTLTNEDVTDALDRLAKRIGGYWYIDPARDLHFFLNAEGAVHSITDADVHSANDIALTTDLTPVRTRVHVEGGGVTALGDVVPGETMIPVQDAAWYSEDGGVVVSGPQRISYTGVVEGGTGGLVGPGAAPSGVPTLTLQSGAGIDSGEHDYAVTFVTAAGESIAGPLASVETTNAIGDPPAGTLLHVDPTQTYDTSATYVAGDTVVFAVTYETATGSTLQSPLSASFVVGGSGSNTHRIVAVNIPVSSDAVVLSKKLWLRKNGTTWYSTVIDPEIEIWNVSTATWAADTPPASNTTDAHQVALSGIPIGASGVTARKVYRTAAGAAQLKLLTTIADNTTTTHSDSAADGTLGANVPTTDTSGLQQPEGQLLAGATSIPVANPAGFATAGGWAVVGNGQQVLRYTGITGNDLTGVPAEGPGAIVASISFNASITQAPALIGVPASGTGAVIYPIGVGDEVNIFVTRDDVAAQAVMAGLVGGDGIHEEFVQDRRLSQTEAEARGDAKLEELKDPIVTATYQTRDLTTRSGLEVTLTLGAPTNISGTFKIQSVTTSQFDARGIIRPLRTVVASSRRNSFESLLRILKAQAA